MDFSVKETEEEGSHKKGRSSYSPFTMKNNYIRPEGTNSSD